MNFAKSLFTTEWNAIYSCSIECYPSRYLLHSVSLGNDTSLTNDNPAIFFVPQVLRNLTSPPRKTKTMIIQGQGGWLDIITSNLLLYPHILHFAPLLTEQFSNIYMKTAWNRERTAWPDRKGIRSAGLDIFFWVLKEIPQKDSPIFSP